MQKAIPCFDHPNASLDTFLSLFPLPILNPLIDHTFEIPSLDCPEGRLVVSSAIVRCSGSGKRALEHKSQLSETALEAVDLHYRYPKLLCILHS